MKPNKFNTDITSNAFQVNSRVSIPGKNGAGGGEEYTSSDFLAKMMRPLGEQIAFNGSKVTETTRVLETSSFPFEDRFSPMRFPEPSFNPNPPVPIPTEFPGLSRLGGFAGLAGISGNVWGGSRLNSQQTESITHSTSHNITPKDSYIAPSFLNQPSNSNYEFVNPEIAKLMSGNFSASNQSAALNIQNEERKSIGARDYVSTEVRQSLSFTGRDLKTSLETNQFPFNKEQFRDPLTYTIPNREIEGRDSLTRKSISNVPIQSSYTSNITETRYSIPKQPDLFPQLDSPFSYKKSVRWNIPGSEGDGNRDLMGLRESQGIKEIQIQQSTNPIPNSISSFKGPIGLQTPNAFKENSPTKITNYSKTVDRGYTRLAMTPGRKSLNSTSKPRIHMVEPGSIGRAKIKIVYTNSPMSVERLREYDEEYIKTQEMIDTEFEDSKRSRFYLLNTIDFLESRH